MSTPITSGTFENLIVYFLADFPCISIKLRIRLYAIMCCMRSCKIGIPCGGHACSEDGLEWSTQVVGAFGPIVTLTNGTVVNNSYVERPQVYQVIPHLLLRSTWPCPLRILTDPHVILTCPAG